MHEEYTNHELIEQKTILEKIKDMYYFKTSEIALKCHSTDGRPNEWFMLPDGSSYKAHIVYANNFKSPVGMTFYFNDNEQNEQLDNNGITCYRETTDDHVNFGSSCTFSELRNDRKRIRAVYGTQRRIKERWLDNY